VIATLSGSWTPLISNDSGTASIGGATAAYGVWFYLVAGIAALSLLVAVGIYFSAMRPRRVLHALPNRPNGQRHKSARQQSIGQRGVNREALVQALSALTRRRGGLTMSIVAWVTLTVPVCLATTRLVAPCRWPAVSPTTASFKSSVVDSRWGRETLRRGSSAGLLVSHRRRLRNPGGASAFRVEDPGKSSTRLLSCAAALAMNIASCSECS
jgi:hypothetical protein